MMRNKLIALLLMTTISLSMIGQDPDDYMPFVSLRKNGEIPVREKFWTSVHTQPGVIPDFAEYSNWLSSSYRFDTFYLSDEVVEKDDKSYCKMMCFNNLGQHYVDDWASPKYNGVMLREKDRKVYVYSELDGIEHLLYDFTLKEGDTFTSYDIDSGVPVKLKVLKEGWLNDGPYIYPYNTMLNYETLQEQKRPLRTWVMGILTETDVYPPIYQEEFTLIEGVGCNEGPFHSYNNTKGCDYLAYVTGGDYSTRTIETDRGTIDVNDELSFPISNTRFATVRGCDMPLGDDGEVALLPVWKGHQLSFELEDNQLHVFGAAFTANGGTHYATFIEVPTKDPLMHYLLFEIPVSSSTTSGAMAWRRTDFRVPGFGPGDLKYAPEGYDPTQIEYVVVDNQGCMYPVKKSQQTVTYRPFIEEDKVWKVGIGTDYRPEYPVEMVEYFYFDGDTVIDGKFCKRMMKQDYAKEGSLGYIIYYNPDKPLNYLGAWYEENKKVYFAAEGQHLQQVYDFGVLPADTVRQDDGFEFTLSTTVGLVTGFKGLCYGLYYPDALCLPGYLSDVWLEGVGSPYHPYMGHYELEGPQGLYAFLMSCTVGDEVLYLNERYEDGVSPDAGAPKRRIDFTHTVKVKPKAPVRRKTDEMEEETLTGDYSDRLLNIDLGKLSNDYSMVIKNQSDSVVYVKSVRANEIVALSIDISDYDGGDYTINIENADEVFSGVFSIDPTAIHEIASDSKENGQQMKEVIYDLTGRPMSKDRLSKGIYIQNGKKVLVR